MRATLFCLSFCPRVLDSIGCNETSVVGMFQLSAVIGGSIRNSCWSLALIDIFGVDGELAVLASSDRRHFWTPEARPPPALDVIALSAKTHDAQEDLPHVASVEQVIRCEIVTVWHS